MAAAAVGVLLKSVSQSSQDTLRNLTMAWYMSDNESHRELSCHILMVFVSELGVRSVKQVLGQVLEHLPGHMKGGDHLAVQALNLATKLVTSDRGLLVTDKFDNIWREVHQCLLHSHSWIRLLSSQLLGLLLSAIPAAKMVDKIASSEELWLSSSTVRSLLLDLIEQLQQPEDSITDLGTQVVKNLVALTKLTLDPGWTELIAGDETAATFSWVCGRLVKVANHELVSTPRQTDKRSLVFDYIGAVCLEAGEGVMNQVLRMVLPPLHREISNVKAANELKTQAQEVVELIKSKVDEEAFNAVYLEIQMKLNKKKGERKAVRMQDFIANPEKAAKRKINQNETKKKSKKAKFKK